MNPSRVCSHAVSTNIGMPDCSSQNKLLHLEKSNAVIFFKMSNWSFWTFSFDFSPSWRCFLIFAHIRVLHYTAPLSCKRGKPFSFFISLVKYRWSPLTASGLFVHRKHTSSVQCTSEVWCMRNGSRTFIWLAFYQCLFLQTQHYVTVSPCFN